MKVLARASKQVKEIEHVRTGNEEVQVYVCIGGMTLYIEIFK